MKNSKRLLLLALVLQACLGSSIQARGGPRRALRRSRRSLFQMCDLIQRHTSRSCLDYYDYGCFCGLGNAGNETKHLDEADACCRLHDSCYAQVTCFWTYPQFVGYSVDCDEGGCRCQDSPYWSPCAHSVCECDLRFAECLGRAPYNEMYRSYGWEQCNRT
ncbi:hypothetical protein ACOMHN_028953 [Nucella lapillus]